MNAIKLSGPCVFCSAAPCCVRVITPVGQKEAREKTEEDIQEFKGLYHI